jgi:hypothetical protein
MPMSLSLADRTEAVNASLYVFSYKEAGFSSLETYPQKI